MPLCSHTLIFINILQQLFQNLPFWLPQIKHLCVAQSYFFPSNWVPCGVVLSVISHLPKGSTNWFLQGHTCLSSITFLCHLQLPIRVQWILTTQQKLLCKSRKGPLHLPNIVHLIQSDSCIQLRFLSLTSFSPDCYHPYSQPSHRLKFWLHHLFSGDLKGSMQLK